MTPEEYEKDCFHDEMSIGPAMDNIKRNLDSLQNLLRSRDLIDVEMHDGRSGEFFTHYVELDHFHALVDNLFYRIQRSCR